jgi:hypothetical protein
MTTPVNGFGVFVPIGRGTKREDVAEAWADCEVALASHVPILLLGDGLAGGLAVDERMVGVATGTCSCDEADSAGDRKAKTTSPTQIAEITSEITS